MKSHRWIPHVVMQTRTFPVQGSPGALRADPLAQAARGIVILALVLGSIGIDAAESSGYGSAGHASAHQPAGNIRLGSAYPIGFRASVDRPWMY